jgi:hypothetical protein
MAIVLSPDIRMPLGEIGLLAVARMLQRTRKLVKFKVITSLGGPSPNF